MTASSAIAFLHRLLRRSDGRTGGLGAQVPARFLTRRKLFGLCAGAAVAPAAVAEPRKVLGMGYWNGRRWVAYGRVDRVLQWEPTTREFHEMRGYLVGERGPELIYPGSA